MKLVYMLLLSMLSAIAVAAPQANDTAQTSDIFIDPTPFYSVMNPIVQKALTVYKEVAEKNQYDLKQLGEALAKKQSPDLRIKVINALAHDHSIMQKLSLYLTQAGGKWRDNFPLYSCLEKFLGSEEFPGIYKEVSILLEKHPEILKGDLSHFGDKGPQAHQITLVKTLMVYGVIAAYGCKNMTNFDETCLVQLIYPTPLFPETTKTEYSIFQRHDICKLVSKLYLSATHPAFEEPLIMFPNAGFVFGGNLFTSQAAQPFRPQPMGDCSSLLGYVYQFEIPNHPTWRFSTRYLEQVYRWHAEGEEPSLEEEYDQAVITKAFHDYRPVELADIKPGDLIVWRPVTCENEMITELVGHIALFLGHGPKENRAITLDFKRENDGRIEGITIREVDLKRGNYDESHIYKTFVLRPAY